jgi:uncharacterized protein (TIGR02147 family)
MENNPVFSFQSYKQIMAHRLSGEGRRGQLTGAAEALNCQRSYLSRVIRSELHLTPDHAFELAKFWLLSADETDYFTLLVEYDRAATPGYRASLKSKLGAIKKKNESIEERTQRKHLSVDLSRTLYFSSWLGSATHFLTCVPTLRTSEAIAQRLGIDQGSVVRTLEQLREQGLVSESKGKWKYEQGEFHVGKESPLVVLHHQNWRQRAVFDAQNFTNENIHFTGILTLSREDAARVKELLLEFISRANSIASPSQPEDAVALTCDLFPV